MMTIFFSNCANLSVLPRVNTMLFLFFFFISKWWNTIFFLPRSLMLRIIKTAPQWRRIVYRYPFSMWFFFSHPNSNFVRYLPYLFEFIPYTLSKCVLYWHVLSSLFMYTYLYIYILYNTSFKLIKSHTTIFKLNFVTQTYK